MKLQSMISRTNDFIQKVEPRLPALGSPAKSSAAASAPVVSAERVKEMIKSAVEAAIPVMSQPLLSMEMAGVGVSTVPVSATDKVDQGELTLKQAQSAKLTCSKCKFQGCSFCMGKWFVPKKVWKGQSSTVPVFEPEKWL